MHERLIPFANLRYIAKRSTVTNRNMIRASLFFKAVSLFLFANNLVLEVKGKDGIFLRGHSSASNKDQEQKVFLNAQKKLRQTESVNTTDDNYYANTTDDDYYANATDDDYYGNSTDDEVEEIYDEVEAIEQGIVEGSITDDEIIEEVEELNEIESELMDVDDFDKLEEGAEEAGQMTLEIIDEVEEKNEDDETMEPADVALETEFPEEDDIPGTAEIVEDIEKLEVDLENADDEVIEEDIETLEEEDVDVDMVLQEIEGMEDPTGSETTEMSTAPVTETAASFEQVEGEATEAEKEEDVQNFVEDLEYADDEVIKEDLEKLEQELDDDEAVEALENFEATEMLTAPITENAVSFEQAEGEVTEEEKEEDVGNFIEDLEYADDKVVKEDLEMLEQELDDDEVIKEFEEFEEMEQDAEEEYEEFEELEKEMENGEIDDDEVTAAIVETQDEIKFQEDLENMEDDQVLIQDAETLEAELDDDEVIEQLEEFEETEEIVKEVEIDAFVEELEDMDDVELLENLEDIEEEIETGEIVVEDDQFLDAIDELEEIEVEKQIENEESLEESSTDDKINFGEQTDPFTSSSSSEASSSESTEKTVEKVSFGILILSFVFMIVTAYQVAENPDGIFASVCRLCITMGVFLLKIIMYPFRRLFGRSYSHQPIHTQDYRQPYRGNSTFEIS